MLILLIVCHMNMEEKRRGSNIATLLRQRVWGDPRNSCKKGERGLAQWRVRAENTLRVFSTSTSSCCLLPPVCAAMLLPLLFCSMVSSRFPPKRDGLFAPGVWGTETRGEKCLPAPAEQTPGNTWSRLHSLVLPKLSLCWESLNVFVETTDICHS